MKTITIIFLSLLLVASGVKAQSDGVPASPPFGNLSADHRFSNLIRSSDPTAFKSITYEGLHNRKIGVVTDRFYQFTVGFEEGLTTEILAKSEFGSFENAEMEAERLAMAIGGMPTILRLHLKQVVVLKGYENAGASGKELYSFPMARVKI